ncbi:MAG: PepSY-associated TM helix domain-containing protein, partial [Verrucomicrobiota bacterium]
EWRMSLATEHTGELRRDFRWRAKFERWNRKLHFYAGLFLLFFMWLFAFTGLLLNHPTWSFPESWNNRKESNFVREITALPIEVKGDLGQARAIMRQVGIEGDILWTTTRTDPNQFDFQARRPGHFFYLKADLRQKRVTVRQADVNLWGVIKVLHVFSGASIDDPRQSRDWTLTTLWAFSMDAVAAGLIFMVLSSLYMWLELPQKRLSGMVVLGLGSLACGLFCVGLRWLF